MRHFDNLLQALNKDPALGGLSHAILLVSCPYNDISPEINLILEKLNMSEHSVDIKHFQGKDFTVDEVRSLDMFLAYEAVSRVKLAIVENIDESPAVALQACL